MLPNAWKEAGIPNPGSDEARALGCTCPVVDNEYGKGFPYPDGNGGMILAFWQNGDCPIHPFTTVRSEEPAVVPEVVKEPVISLDDQVSILSRYMDVAIKTAQELLLDPVYVGRMKSLALSRAATVGAQYGCSSWLKTAAELYSEANEEFADFLVYLCMEKHVLDCEYEGVPVGTVL